MKLRAMVDLMLVADLFEVFGGIVEREKHLNVMDLAQAQT